jgi:hypothetical protein
MYGINYYKTKNTQNDRWKVLYTDNLYDDEWLKITMISNSIIYQNIIDNIINNPIDSNDHRDIIDSSSPYCELINSVTVYYSNDALTIHKI